MSISCFITTLMGKDLKPEATRFLASVGCISLCCHMLRHHRKDRVVSRYRWVPGEPSPRSSHILSAWGWLQIFTSQTKLTAFHFFLFSIYYSFSESWWGEIFSSRGNNIKLKSCVWWNGEIIPLLSFEQKKEIIRQPEAASRGFTIARLEGNITALDEQGFLLTC